MVLPPGSSSQDLIAHDRSTLNGEQSEGSAAKGVGDEDLGSIARLVGILVSHQAQALVGQGRPDRLTVCHPPRR